MRGLKASVYKDICLFLSVSGLIGLLLPALIAAAMLLGLNDSQDADRLLEPFKIAVYDRDDTFMSRSLISQLRNVELFSAVTVYREEDLAADGARLDENGRLKAEDALFADPRFSDCAAVITIPYDYFYDAYTGDEGPVSVLLNGKMPLEGALTDTLASSVSAIIKSERSAWYAAYMLRSGGGFDQSEYRDFCADAAESILDSALGRRAVLNDPNPHAGLRTAATQSFFACACSMLLLFVTAGVVKTLPDERGLGLLSRYVSLGGSLAGLIFSKFIAALMLCSAGLAPVILILRPALTPLSAAAIGAMFIACFLVMLALSSICRSTEQFMLSAGLITAASLLFGGTIYPAALMPAFARAIGKATAPKYLLAALSGGGAKESLLPLALIAAIALALFLAAEAAKRGLRAGAGKRERRAADA